MLAIILDRVRERHNDVLENGLTNDRGKQYLRSLFDLATYDYYDSVISLVRESSKFVLEKIPFVYTLSEHSTATHSNQGLSLDTVAYRLDGGGKRKMTVNVS